MVLGFQNELYKGRRIFIRKEYEKYHKNKTEKERLEEITGKSYSTLLCGILDCYNSDRALIYREYEASLDFSLRKTISVKDLWHPYESGFIHEITGEYIPDMITKPKRDSWPAWAYFPRKYERKMSDTIVDIMMLAVALDSIGDAIKKSH